MSTFLICKFDWTFYKRYDAQCESMLELCKALVNDPAGIRLRKDAMVVGDIHGDLLGIIAVLTSCIHEKENVIGFKYLKGLLSNCVCRISI